VVTDGSGTREDCTSVHGQSHKAPVQWIWCLDTTLRYTVTIRGNRNAPEVIIVAKFALFMNSKNKRGWNVWVNFTCLIYRTQLLAEGSFDGLGTYRSGKKNTIAGYQTADRLTDIYITLNLLGVFYVSVARLPANFWSVNFRPSHGQSHSHILRECLPKRFAQRG